MLAEQIATDRIKAECDRLDLDPAWAMTELRDDLGDISNGTL